MKTLIVLFIVFLSSASFSQAPKNNTEKTYTQKELEIEVSKRVKSEVKAVLDKIKPNNVLEFSKQLLEKEERMKIRELEIAKREEELGLSKREVEGKLVDFQKQQQRYITCVEDIEKEENERVRHMVNIVGGMRPKNAADILSVQDAVIAVRIMAMLDPEKVSKIFNLMDKEISARLQKQYMTMKK